MLPTRPSFVLALAAVLALTPAVQAQPAHILMIRHGEKDPNDPKATGLTWEGQARAAALVFYLQDSPALKPLGKPTVLFAQSSPPGHSERPFLTIKPYASSFNPPLPIDQQFASKEYTKLVQHLLKDEKGLYKGKTILICWEHENLALMADELCKELAKKDIKVKGAPAKWEWPGKQVYGRTWVFTFTDPKTCEYHDHGQKLMYDDAK